MSAGSPRAAHPDNDRLAMRQAAHIHSLAARHVPHRDIAAAAGCTVARVRAVLTQPVPDVDDQPEPDDDHVEQGPVPTRRAKTRALARARAATVTDDVTPLPEFMTVTEIAHSLRVNKMSIYRLIHDGHLPAIHIGRVYRVTARDVAAYIDSARTDLTPSASKHITEEHPS